MNIQQDSEDRIEVDHSSSSSQSTALISRRRLAFRPPVTTHTKKTTLTLSQEDKGENGARVVDSTLLSAEAKSTSSQEGILLKSNPNTAASEADKARRIFWTSQEQAIFYEALKLHGKDFEAVSKYMRKKKLLKDREQVRNYYLNTFKVWSKKCKAHIEDADWANIPKDARELFVLLNGCEWRKRLNGLSFDAEKFRRLVLEGFVSFRPKRKKFIVTLKTPYCPALLKYFPYGKRNAEIPSHLSIRLTPLKNQDMEFVVSCEQNPFLLIHCNVNDKISALFQLLKRKWSFPVQQIEEPLNTSKIRLFVDEKIQSIHNVLIGEDETSSLLSLKKLKKDFETGGTEPYKTLASVAGRQEIKLSTSSVKEVFEINEAKIRAGLGADSAGNASMLQLFYMLGMKKELSFNYMISEPESKFQSWQLFKSLISRDYDESMAKLTANPSEMPVNNSLVTPIISENESQQQNVELSTRTPEAKSNQTTIVAKGIGIVEQENMQFIKQLKAQSNNIQNKRPKRQIKLVPNNQRIFTRITAPNLTSQEPRNVCICDGVVFDFVAPNQQRNSAVSYVIGGGGSNGTAKMSFAQNTIQTNSQTTRKVLDFSVLHPTCPPTSSTTTFQAAIVPKDPVPSSSTVDISGEFSLDSNSISQFHPIVLDNSPNKSLPEDVRTAYEQMLKENSVDYCRQFEQLANMHQQESSPAKTTNLKEI